MGHYALTKSQTQQLEAIQKRVIQIVLNFSRGMPYTSMLFAADLNSLASRREDISRKFFQDITKSTSCLHHLLPDPKLYHYSRLRSYEKFPRPYILALNNIVHLCSMHSATTRTEYTMLRYTNRQIRFLLSTNSNTPHLTATIIRNFTILLYCIIASFIVFYCITVRVILLYYGTCICSYRY